MSDIISRVILRDLDQKVIFKYLEGLAPLKKDSVALREFIKEKKKNFFTDIKNQEDGNKQVHNGIMRDCSEYWSYIRKNGVIFFLVCTYDEMKDRIDLEKSQESNLADEFSILKSNISKIREIFNTLEKELRVKKEQLNLDSFR